MEMLVAASPGGLSPHNVTKHDIRDAAMHLHGREDSARFRASSGL